MTARRYWFIARTWVRNMLSGRALTAVLSSFGTLWLAVEITTFFFQDTTIPAWLRSHWWLFAMVGLIAAVARCKPNLRISHKLRGRDVTVEIAVGDVFSFEGALVVGSNTTFDTRLSKSLISEKSVQGSFTKRHYSDEAQIDREIDAGLRGFSPEQLNGQRKGKGKRYPVGTVVRLTPKGRTAYLVAISDINEHGVAEGNFEKLKTALAELWVYIGSHGMKEQIVMPVLGTGFSRLTTTREEVVREILRSFVAACSEKVFSERLTVVIYPRDIETYQVSLEELGAFLKHLCTYTAFSADRGGEIGKPV